MIPIPLLGFLEVTVTWVVLRNRTAAKPTLGPHRILDERYIPLH